jgi:hypothetical protein
MIRIQTTLPSRSGGTPTYSRRFSTALRVARLLPSYAADGPPHTLSETDAVSVFVLDEAGDWTCRIRGEGEANQIVDLTHRHAAQHPGIEFTFASWLVACNPGWIILIGAGPEPQKVSVDVTFCVSLPKQFMPEELATISFEIPMEAVKVFIDGHVVPGAGLTSYMTSVDVEVSS